eukprot:gnl/Dysnectes_brevis/609_a673_2093.p1 GENE.gnl/Dysnectes_brevis/609_a673_2093~~gnl/Dysnectes_brevis/609_a673_2093.p1  ORF type:complete len:345 (-),score=48.72 gnl/Dysnectes_brevis/609_a673_2093:2-1036(-)
MKVLVVSLGIHHSLWLLNLLKYLSTTRHKIHLASIERHPNHYPELFSSAFSYTDPTAHRAPIHLTPNTSVSASVTFHQLDVGPILPVLGKGHTHHQGFSPDAVIPMTSISTKDLKRFLECAQSSLRRVCKTVRPHIIIVNHLLPIAQAALTARDCPCIVVVYHQELIHLLDSRRGEKWLPLVRISLKRPAPTTLLALGPRIRLRLTQLFPGANVVQGRPAVDLPSFRPLPPADELRKLLATRTRGQPPGRSRHRTRSFTGWLWDQPVRRWGTALDQAGLHCPCTADRDLLRVITDRPAHPLFLASGALTRRQGMQLAVMAAPLLLQDLPDGALMIEGGGCMRPP